jgi:hypothetical protein
MTTTKQEKLNQQRFGCSLRVRTGVFCIDWKGKSAAQAADASIFALLVRVSTKAGPIIVLGLEISSVRPLPNYFYFPFDLKRTIHKDHLLRLTEAGEIKLSFLTGKRQLLRTHQLSLFLRNRSAELYAEALQELPTEPDKYDFAKALLLLENHVRIPELMQRILLEENFREISEKTGKMIQKVPNENRELARNCVREAGERFLPYYRNNRKQFLENLQLARRGSTLVLDFHRFFSDKPEALNAFLSDALAASFSRQELENLSNLGKFVVSLAQLPFKEQQPAPPPPDDPKPGVPELPAGLVSLVQLMTQSGISKESASKFFDLLGLEVGGKPGRHTKDYSEEYALKMSGSSWSQVARFALANRGESQTEFGERDYDSLGFSDQERLKHRIRQGVRGYANRIGKLLPSES